MKKIAQEKKHDPAHKKKRVTRAPAHSLQNDAGMQPRMRLGFVLLSILTLTAIFFWPVISAKGVFWNDFIQQYFPYRIFASVSLRQGVFPFWNPYLFSGMPFFADIQTAVLYPLNLALVLFSSPQWLSPYIFELQIILHVAFAGFAMYLCARDFRISMAGALCAALTFMFCGFTTAHIFHVTMIHSLGWIVLSIWAVRRMLDTRKLIWVAASAFFLWMVCLAGHPQLMLYTYYWIGAYLLYHSIILLKEKKGYRPVALSIGLFIAAVTLSFGLSSIQLLPTRALGEHSIRASISYEKSTECSLRPYRLVTLIAPNFFGTPNNFFSKKRPFYWGMSEADRSPGAHYYWETAIYIGIVPLALMLCAILLGRSPPVVFLSLMSLISLLLAMGNSFFLHWIAYHVLPGFSRFRIPGRFAAMFSISASLCAGFGFMWCINRARLLPDTIRKRFLTVLGVLAACAFGITILFQAGAFNGNLASFLASSGIFGHNMSRLTAITEKMIQPSAAGSMWRFTLFFILFSAVVAAALLKKISARTTAAALLVILVFDLFSFGWGFCAQKKSPDSIYPRTQLIQQIKRQYENELFRINSRNSKPGTKGLNGSYLLFHKNAGSVHRMFLMEGYTPLRLRRKFINRRDVTLDILNTKYKIEVDRKSGRKSLALHTSYLPRAWMAYDYRVVTGQERIKQVLYSSQFDHTRGIILEEKPRWSQDELRFDSTARVSITNYSLNSIQLEVTTQSNGFLLLSEIHYPEWNASVDGKKVPLYRANYALRAIPVPQGTHRVSCSYESGPFTKGSLITLAGMFVLCSLIAAALVSRFHQN